MIDLFQSTPVIANGRIRRARLYVRTLDCFNPRPLLLTGESPTMDDGYALFHAFQSTPVIANGRILLSRRTALTHERFQSTPVIANGRIYTTPDGLPLYEVFQSTPVIANGRIMVAEVGDRANRAVSIHARYC